MFDEKLKIHGNNILSTIADLSDFDCGNARINDYFKNQAKKDTEKHISNASVFFNGSNDFIGFYSLSAANVEIKGAYDYKKFEDVPGSNKYLSKFVTYPALKIDCFAINKKFQNQKFGMQMMFKIFVSAYLLSLTANIAITSIILDAVDEATDFYEGLGFDYIHHDYIPGLSDKTFPMMIRMDKVEAIIMRMDLDFPETFTDWLS